MRTIAVVNQKGGCGKTTTAINLAAELALRGHRTLLVDMDPQGHCAAGLGVPEERIERSVLDALLQDLERGPDPASILWEVARNLYLAPSGVGLAALEAPNGPAASLPDRDRRLAKLLRRLDSRFEFCLVDCPPTIGLLTFNALRAADEALVPVETGFFSLRGAERQWATIRKVSERLGRVIPVRLLATLHDPDRKVARDVLAALEERFADALIPHRIHEHEVLREAAGLGQPVREFAPQSEAVRDFEALAEWMLASGPRPEPPSVEVDRRAVSTMLGDRGGRGPAEPAEGGGGRDGDRAAELVRRMKRGGAPEDPLAAIRGDAAGSGAEAWPQAGSGDSEGVATAVRSRTERPMGVSFGPEGVRFAQPAAGAAEMAIRGDFGHAFGGGWQVFQMRREAGDLFELTVPLPPGRYEYQLLIDGVASPDPFNLERIERRAVGGTEAVAAEGSVDPLGTTNLLIVPGR
jgi:chromosome partitioning protein